MKKSKTLVYFFLLFWVSALNSQTELRYTTFLQEVKTTHPLALRAATVAEVGQRQFQAARGNYDPILKSDIEGKFFQGKQYYTVSKSEIKQALFTSQYVKAGYEYGQGLLLNPQGSTPSFGLPYVGVEMSLLQGLVIDKRRAEVLKGSYYRNFYQLESASQINDLLYEGSLAYYNALYAKKQVGLNSFFVDLAAQRLVALGDLAAVGERPAIDTTEAAILYQGRELDRQMSRADLIKAGNDLRFFLQSSGRPTEIELVPADSLELCFENALGYFQAIVNQDLAQNPVLQQYAAKRGILETEVRLKREQIKPKLDVSYNFINGSLAPDQLYFGTANYKYGASFSFPLLARNARHEHRIAKLNAVSNEFDFQTKQSQLDFKRKALFENGRLLIAQVTTARRAVAYSKLLVEAERLKFMNGESSLFLLNTRENKWLESELKLADYEYKFLKLVAEAIYLTGNLAYTGS